MQPPSTNQLNHPDMQGARKIYTENFLFSLNVFILLLLVFENHLVIPEWLQPLGRMHAMILHFPIVLLLVSMVLECFRFKPAYDSQEFYRIFTSNLLLTGVASAALTVIMGIVLSREQGYNHGVLTWHKWLGAGVYFIASAIYTIRNFSWYKASVARVSALTIALCLILAGHFGASLTHGDNYIWQPVLAHGEEVVPVEEALVYDHVVRPVFQNKCASCHNPEKLKGKLVLTDSASIIKGGKTGALVEWGKPDTSLLIKRINLPVENKKHMPPAGKPQLTPDETELLYHWIKSAPRFTTRVLALSPEDSLRMMATSLLKSAESKGHVFEFAAADESTIEKLNSNYRVVLPIANGSPALAVNIYSRNNYSPGLLDELKDVQTQIVSLEASKMPVRNEDLKYIARFENLRDLNLNFTEITGDGLKTLASLERLARLSLSGTKISYGGLLENLGSFKNLNTLAVWDTPLSASEVQQLKSAYKQIQFLEGFSDDGSHPIKLNPPRLKNKPAVFHDSVLLELVHPVKGVDIRYTTDGSEPDSARSRLFAANTMLTETTLMKARAYKSGWLTSDVATLNVYKCAYRPDTIILGSRLNPVHAANGAQTFFDRELGGFNANSPAWANNWAGFIRNDMELLMKFNNPRHIGSVSINTLIETETVIFPPASIEIWGGASENDLHLIVRKNPDLPHAYSKPFIKLIDCSFRAQDVSCLKIIAKPLMKLPAWHKRKGRPALLLVDEILIN